MKKTKLMLFALVAVMVAFAIAPVCGVMAADDTLTVSILVEGQTKTLAYDGEYEYKVPTGTDIDEVYFVDVLKQFLDGKNIEYDMPVHDKYGAFIQTIGDETNVAAPIDGHWLSWMFGVNNTPSINGVSGELVNDGDEFVVAFIDSSALFLDGYNVERDAKGNYTLYLDGIVLGYNDYEYEPIVGATVTLNETKLDGVTDEKGGIALPEQFTKGGLYEIQIERFLADITNNGEKVRSVPPLTPGTVIEVSNFTDLDGAKWAQDNIYNLVNLGIINGMTPTEYAPGADLTRAQLVKMLFVTAQCYDEKLTEEEFLGKTSFDDVPVGGWYTPYVNWAVANEITNGVGKTTFAPNDPVTREQASTFIYRFVNDYKKVTLEDKGTAVEFDDASTISDWAKTPVEVMSKAGIITGKEVGGVMVFQPTVNATRAEAAALISRMIGQVDAALETADTEPAE